MNRLAQDSEVAHGAHRPKAISSDGANAQPTSIDNSAIGLGQIVARGATFLFLSQFGSAVIGLLGSIILVRLLVSPSEYAPIGLAVTVPGLVMLGDVTGINQSLTRYLSEYKRSRNSNAIWSSFWTGTILKATTGLILSAVAYFAAGPIAVLIGKPQVIPFFLVAAPLPFVWVTQVNVKSVLLALDAPRGYSLLQVLNEILLTVSPILAVLFGLGALGALSYMVLANFVYLAIAYAYCILVVLSATERTQRQFTLSATVRKLTAFGAPLGFSNSFSSFAGQVVNLIVARFVALDVYGLYSVAQSASGFLGYVVDPIKSMLLPAYSRIADIKNSDLMKSLCIQTTRYETAFVLPATLFFIVFASPFIVLLYGVQYASSGLILTLVAASFLPVGLANDALTTFLMTSGFTRYVGGVMIVSSVSIIAIAVLAVPTFGLLGFLLASIFSFVPGYLLIVSKARSALGLGPPIAFVKPLYYALLFTGAASGIIIFAPVPPFAMVLAGLVLVPVLFVVFSALFRAIEPADFVRLRGMMATQSVIPRLIGPLIELSERLVIFIRRD
ncbi:MAG TPA: oligosaccharide flippase family protein [Nitrososphaerales archaeon]|nr:oligosaccharide flippase family protein [Nitrososphaerales archaeon]